MRLIIFFCLCFVGVSSAVFAQVKEKQFNDWTVYTTTLDGRKTCYIASLPVKNSGNFSKRSDPYFLVTRVDGSVDEVSTSSGYSYKGNSEVKLDIDNKKFDLFTDDERAWAHDGKADQAIVAAMKKGSSMSVRGTSSKGTYSVDKYSLKGVSAAYDHMVKLCSN